MGRARTCELEAANHWRWGVSGYLQSDSGGVQHDVRVMEGAKGERRGYASSSAHGLVLMERAFRKRYCEV